MKVRGLRPSEQTIPMLGVMARAIYDVTDTYTSDPTERDEEWAMLVGTMRSFPEEDCIARECFEQARAALTAIRKPTHYRFCYHYPPRLGEKLTHWDIRDLWQRQISAILSGDC